MQVYSDKLKIKKNSTKYSLSSLYLQKISKIYLLSCLFIIAVYLFTEITTVSIYELVADANEVGGVAPYTGFVSIIGVLLFCAAASICLFSSKVIETRTETIKEWNVFLKFSGYLILLFLVDDLWQIHENFSTLIFGSEANISLTNRSLQNLLETLVFGGYGLILLIYLLRFKKLIFQTKFLPLILAFIFLGLSVLIDICLENISGHFILEEGFKLLGIVSLLMYYTEVCWQQLTIETLTKQSKIRQ